MNKQEMNPIEYQLKLWQTRSELQRKAIFKPINEMVKAGIIEKDPKYTNFLLGRVKDEEFLEKLITFNDSLE